MKVLSLYASNSSNDFGLSKVEKIIYDTFSELGEQVARIDLKNMQIPYYDSTTTPFIEDIMKEIKEATGIILVFTTNLNAPCAVMQTFIEYFSHPSYESYLNNKNIFSVTVSKNTGELSSLLYISKFLYSMNAFDATKLGLNMGMLADATLEDNIAKYTEDYYRILRQNRKFIIPKDTYQTPSNPLVNGINMNLSEEEYSILSANDKKPKISLQELEKKYDLTSFTQRQEEDINEITQFFASKFKENVSENKVNPIFKEDFSKNVPPPIPRAKSCKQLTLSLPHHFKPQFSEGLNIVVLISISREESFDIVLNISNLECQCYEGKVDSPDLTILCTQNIWADILKGKYTAQKAFMIGHLKVRGNFVLLSKFDQLFTFDNF